MTTFLPADCAVCAGPMAAWSATPVCDACTAAVLPQSETLCRVCGAAVGFESLRFAAAFFGSAETSCTMCRMAPPEFSKAVAFGLYADELREMLHLLKYDRVTRLADGVLGARMAETLLRLEAVAAREALVIAVPLFATREKKRGFNQSVLLADAAIRRVRKLRPAWTLRAAHVALLRVKDTRELFALHARDRRANVRGAFRVADAAAVAGREVILIDDIMTTGATARECARVLIQAGAAKVWVGTLARAQAEGAGLSSGVALWDAKEPGATVGFL